MSAYGLKGGIGSASRVVEAPGLAATWATLVLANLGRLSELVVAGRRVGAVLARELRADPDPLGAGSVIVVVATDAPLSERQLARVLRRAQSGIARTGSNAPRERRDRRRLHDGDADPARRRGADDPAGAAQRGWSADRPALHGGRRGDRGGHPERALQRRGRRRPGRGSPRRASRSSGSQNCLQQPNERRDWCNDLVARPDRPHPTHDARDDRGACREARRRAVSLQRGRAHLPAQLGHGQRLAVPVEAERPLRHPPRRADPHRPELGQRRPRRHQPADRRGRRDRLLVRERPRPHERGLRAGATAGRTRATSSSSTPPSSRARSRTGSTTRRT